VSNNILLKYLILPVLSQDWRNTDAASTELQEPTLRKAGTVRDARLSCRPGEGAEQVLPRPAEVTMDALAWAVMLGIVCKPPHQGQPIFTLDAIFF
jgi:hypothetical protein